jgi:membrane protease YdiL (CAAX protease family)
MGGAPGISRPGHRGIFDLEGRAAPGLYAAGWGLTVIGLAALLVVLAAESSVARSWLLVGGLVALVLGLVAAAGAQGLQRAADGVAGYAGPSPWLVFAAAFLGSLLVVAVMAFVLRVAQIEISDQAAVLLSTLVSGVVSVGLIRLLVIGPGALRWRDLGIRRPGPGEGSLIGDVGWGVATAIPAIAAAAVVAGLLIALLGVTPDQTLPPTQDALGTAMNLVAAVAVAPLWEELFFRGFTTTAWARTAGPRAAIVRAGLFFALIHVTTVLGSDFSTGLRVAIIAFAVRVPVGLLLGWIFLARRSLVASIALHAAYNGLPLVLVLLAGSRVTSG